MARSKQALDDTRGAAPRADELYETLLRLVLSGERPPGSKLPPERTLAQQLGTNRNTLREAIRRLEAANLVSSRQGRGITVRDYRREAGIELLGPFLQYGHDPREKFSVILDLLAPRASMAELLVRLAAARATSEDLANLERVMRDARRAEREGKLSSLAAAQDAWLRCLVEAAHNVPIRWVANPFLEALRDLVARHPTMVFVEPSFADQAAEILAALTARDVDSAVGATRRFHDRVDAILRKTFLELLRQSFDEPATPRTPKAARPSSRRSATSPRTTSKQKSRP